MSTMIEIQIAAAPVRDSIPKDLPLDERILFAMRYVRQHQNDLFFMTGNVTDDLMLRTSLAAVMLAGNEEDRDMITRSMMPIKMLSAAASGIPVDWSQFSADGCLPLMKLFADSAKAAEVKG